MIHIEPVSNTVDVQERRYTASVEAHGKVFAVMHNPEGPFTREQAFTKARSQTLPVVFVPHTGRHHRYGRVFDPFAFEKEVYLATPDASEPCEDVDVAWAEYAKWLVGFRKNPDEILKTVSGFNEKAKDAYKAHLAAREGLLPAA